MGDDGVGVLIAKSLRKLDLGRQVVILERLAADISLLGYAKEASKLVIVDAIKSGNPPGTVTRFSTEDRGSPVPSIPLSHESGLGDIRALAKAGGVRTPITVIGVEPADCSPGRGLSKPVADAVPLLLSNVEDEVKDYAGRTGRGKTKPAVSGTS